MTIEIKCNHLILIIPNETVNSRIIYKVVSSVEYVHK